MTAATVPLRWLRPGIYRWLGPVTLIGDAARRRAVTVYREPDGTTCVIVRRTWFRRWLR